MQASARSLRPRGRLNGGPNLTLGHYPELSKFLLVSFLIFIVFRYLEGGQRIEFLGQIRFELIVGLLLSVVGIVLFLKDKTRPSTSAMKWAMALAFWMLVMVVLSADVAFSWKIYFDRLVKFMMVTIFIAAFVVNPTILRLFLAAYLLAFAKMVQEGIHGIITGSLIWENQGVMRLHGPTWSYAHPNSFSGTQLGTLPYLYHLAVLAPLPLRLAMIAQGIGALVIILYCGSRTAYLGFFAWLVVLIARARSSFKAVAVLLGIAIAVTPLIPAQYFARLETVYTQKEIEGASIDARKEILTDAWTIFVEHPMGVGVGAFPIVREARFGRSQDTHNLYLEVATNLGFVGFVLFIGMLVSMMRTLLQLSKKLTVQIERMDAICPEPDKAEPKDAAALAHRRDLKVMLATVQATSSFLIIRMTLGIFGHDLYEVYWWFMLGITISMNRMETHALARTDELCGGTEGKPQPGRQGVGRAARLART
jgi:O-antigen ligase